MILDDRRLCWSERQALALFHRLPPAWWREQRVDLVVNPDPVAEQMLRELEVFVGAVEPTVERWLTTREACELLAVPKSTLLTWKHLIPNRPGGAHGSWLWFEDAVLSRRIQTERAA